MSSENYQMLAKTFEGLEEVLKTELEEIGASDVEVVIRGVKFSGSKELLYRANFCCRTALRILRIIGEFKVKSPNDLYQNVYKMEWENYFDVNETFAINSTVNSEAFNNSMFVSLKTKDAIVDRFRSKFDKRPSVNTETPDFRVNVHASADLCTISLDSSGESLHKRGYRVGQNEASMSEVLAAGILKIAGWKGQTDFYDTMCGSGTIPIEAALMARNIPPGIFRQEFAFETWKDFDKDLFEKVYNDDYEQPFEHQIYATDFSAISIKVAEKNAKSAGVLKSINFKEFDFAAYEPQKPGGLLVINPPYGERMNNRKVEPIYNMIGDQLKRNFQGFKAWVFSSSEEGFKSIGLKPTQKIPLVNGSLECSFRLFEVYEGSKKASNQTPEGDRIERDFKPGIRRDKPDGDRKREGFQTVKRNEDRRWGASNERTGTDRKRDHSNTAPRREGFQGDRKRDERTGASKDRFSTDRRRDQPSSGRRTEGFSTERKSDDRAGASKERFSNDRKQGGFGSGARKEGFSTDKRREDRPGASTTRFSNDRKRDDSGSRGRREGFSPERRRDDSKSGSSGPRFSSDRPRKDTEADKRREAFHSERRNNDLGFGSNKDGHKPDDRRNSTSPERIPRKDTGSATSRAKKEPLENAKPKRPRIK